MRNISPIVATIIRPTLVLCLLVALPARASDWPVQGADAGMTKYSPASISAGAALQLSYRKRFYTDWRAYTGNYYYGYSVVVRNKQAMLFCNDQDDLQRLTSNRIPAFTEFNWATGLALARFTTPFATSANAREIDSHHFSNPLIWHSDGRIYARRGGDLRAIFALDVDARSWIGIPSLPPPGGSSWGGDANAFLQVYGDYLLYRYGDTRDAVPYAAYDISPAAWAEDSVGMPWMSIGPSIANKYWYYGDMPKAACNVAVVAACDYPGVTLSARNLNTGATWTRSFASDYGGNIGFYTSISDYWRFVASEEGYYVLFTRATQPTIRVLDMLTGQDKWSYPLTNASERPLLACHNGVLYVIGRAQQLKLSLANGSVIWQQNQSFPNDYGYTHANYENGNPVTSDPLYRPMVLTDDSLWFVDGQNPGSGTLVGMRTSDGTVIQRIDLAALYSGTEHLQYVNDLMTADGKLGLLVSVSDTNDPNHGVAFYQDLYVYMPTPSNSRFVTAVATTGGTVSPSGDVTVSSGTSQTITITPDSGYALTDVQVDGVSVGKVSAYTFSNVTANHTLAASFEPRALVGWWRLDDAAGTAASDSSGNGNSADLLNGPAWTTGVIGGGLNLDGSDDYVLTSQDMTTLFPSTSVTIALWFKAAAGGVLVSELGAHTVSSDWNNSQIEVLDTGEVKALAWGLPPISLGWVGFGSWHHVAMRYNQITQTLDGFLDGVRSTASATGNRTAPWAAGRQLYYAFGAASPANLGNGRNFKGTMDDLRVYSGALPAEDIAALANAGPATCALTLTRSGYGSGTVTLNPPGGAYAAGTVVTLTATADTGNTFFGWSGDLSGTTSPVTITMNIDRSVDARFLGPPVIGDINRDGYVNVGDLQVLVAAWNKSKGVYGYDARADLDGNNIINVADLQILVAHWAEHY